MDDIRHAISTHSPRLFDQLRLHIRNHGLAYQTEKTYLFWIRRYILFHRKKHPKTMGAAEVGEFLSHLANARHCSVNTQRTVLNALVYLYRRFFNVELTLINYEPAKTPRRLPVVYSRDEIALILRQLKGSYRMMAELMYGSGLRQARYKRWVWRSLFTRCTSQKMSQCRQRHGLAVFMASIAYWSQ